MTTTSVYLQRDTWDLALDVSGNIAVCDEPYRIAQDAATAIRTFQEDCIYDVTLGIPYWTQILGQQAPIELIRSYFLNEATSVPGAASAVVYLRNDPQRGIGGQVQIAQVTTSSTAGPTDIRVNPSPPFTVPFYFDGTYSYNGIQVNSGYVSTAV